MNERKKEKYEERKKERVVGELNRWINTFSKKHYYQMKRKQPHLGIQLGSHISFPSTITVTL